MRFWIIAAVAGTALLAQAPAQQESALLNGQNALKTAERAVQLAESLAIAFPELNRAGGPLIDSSRQALASLKGRANHSGYSYSLLSNMRAFLAAADAVGKPFPIPPEAMKQWTELQALVARFDIHFRALLDSAEFRLRSPDRDNLLRYSDANARLAPPTSGSPRVVFLGDSITDGWRLNEYFAGRDYVNRGISGQITGEMLGRMKADVLDLKPQAVLILAGTNDLARRVPITTIQNNYAMIADLAAAYKIKVIFASVLPIHDYNKDKNPNFEHSRNRPPQSILALNSWLRTYCAANGHTYLDYFTALVDRSGMLQAELADDGLHPNSNGYRIMAPLASAAIDRVLGPASAQPDPKKKRLFGKPKPPDLPKPATPPASAPNT